MSLGGAPASVYKGSKEGGRPAIIGRARRSPTPSGSRTPPFPSWNRIRGGGKRGERGGRGAGPLSLSYSDQRGGVGLLPFGLSPLFPYGPIRPIYSPANSVTLRYSEKYPNHSELFRCLNIVVQYIDLYVSTISRLLVMSPISSGTPNYLRYIKTHKLVISIIIECQACGPYGFENYVDMTETPLRSITNSGTWMLILVPTYSMKIFIGQTA